MANIASGTSTRADSASRHMQACRLNTSLALSLAKNSRDELRRNKYKWCMHKDELAMSAGRPLFESENTINKNRHAYPAVITTLDGLSDVTQGHMRALAGCMDHNSFLGEIDRLKTRDHLKEADNELLRNMPVMLPVGYSVGLAYADEYNGDTVASVMIGGVVTVLNGAFPMYTGDLVHAYWQFEEKDFQANGARSPLARNEIDEDSATKRRKTFQQRAYGMSEKINKNGSMTTKDNVALPKPWCYSESSFMDTQRIFGRALCSARPYEMVDILINRQSM
jgi:hypothetical protein